MKLSPILKLSLLLGFISAVLAACNSSSWRNDPAVQAAKKACQTQTGLDYRCVEQAAVTASNPDICRLVGISIDDMCLQAVYEAANDPAICDRIYLQGVVPNCREYYAQFTLRSSRPTETVVKATQTSFASATVPPTSTTILTREATITVTPTPLFVLDLSRYDPDLLPPIVVEHRPPLIARSNEAAQLVFSVINTIYCPVLERNCRLEPVLHYTYGEAEAFNTIPLHQEIVYEMESLVARLPATDQAGRSLRYYAEFIVPEAGYTLRYPNAGTIDLFVPSNLVLIELPPENAVQPGDKVYSFLWGDGPDKVRSTLYSPHGHRAGPPAMDIAHDGRIALMDPINERIIIFDPKAGTLTNWPLPFTYQFNSNLAFNREGRLMVCDYQGKEDPISGVSIPYCYRLDLSGKLEVAAPVYARFPGEITREHQVLDGYDHRLVVPFGAEGEANDRETQRRKLPWLLPYQYLTAEQGLDPFTMRFADIPQRLAFEIHCRSSLGEIRRVERTPQGYLLAFSSSYEQIRAIWINEAGDILKDVTIPNGQYSDMAFEGQVAIAEDGSLYVMSSTASGIEIHYVKAP